MTSVMPAEDAADGGGADGGGADGGGADGGGAEVYLEAALSITAAAALVGSLLALLTLYTRHRTRPGHALETQTLAALTFLTASDLCYSGAVTPASLCRVPAGEVYRARGLCTAYTLYSPYLANVFLKASTWLMLVAVGCCFLPVCRPRAAGVPRRYLTVALLGTGVLLAAPLALLPLAWSYRLEPAGGALWRLRPGWYPTSASATDLFTYLWGIAGCIVPVTLLTFFVGLLAWVKRRDYGQESRRGDARHAQLHPVPILIGLAGHYALFTVPYEVYNMYFCGYATPGLVEEPALGATRLLYTCGVLLKPGIYLAASPPLRQALLTLLWRAPFAHYDLPPAGGARHVVWSARPPVPARVTTLAAPTSAGTASTCTSITGRTLSSIPEVVEKSASEHSEHGCAETAV